MRAFGPDYACDLYHALTGRPWNEGMVARERRVVRESRCQSLPAESNGVLVRGLGWVAGPEADR
jgi:hypothetical protein